MWFILFLLFLLLPSYPNLNYKLEPSPSLVYTHSIVTWLCDSSLSVEPLTLAASVQHLLQSCFGWSFLLQSCVGEVFSCCCPVYAKGCCHPLIEGAVTCIEGAVTCIEGTVTLWRVPLSLLEGAAPILKGAAACGGDNAGCQGYILSVTPFVCCCLILTVAGCGLGFYCWGFTPYLSWLWWHKSSFKQWHFRSLIDLNQTLTEHNTQDLFLCGCFIFRGKAVDRYVSHLNAYY